MVWKVRRARREETAVCPKHCLGSIYLLAAELLSALRPTNDRPTDKPNGNRIVDVDTSSGVCLSYSLSLILSLSLPLFAHEEAVLSFGSVFAIGRARSA